MNKPKAEKRVLAWDGKQWVRAIWVAKHTKEQDTDSDWHDYNEADDTYYWPEGWYEVQTHGGDEMFWHITDGVQEWREMPAAPSGEQRQDCEPVAWMDADGDIFDIEPPANWNPPHTPLYAAPPKREPLSEDEMWQLWNSCGVDDMDQSEAFTFARAIERAHQIGGQS